MHGLEVSQVALSGGMGEGVTMPLGAAAVVALSVGNALIGCGVFDLAVFEKRGIPAAKVTGVATVQDLLDGTVRAVNAPAAALGVAVGQSGRQAAELLLQAQPAATTAQ
ncbi:MAG: YunC family protein [Candidatus Marinimicrobia bacterium]|nr:YunC family protein [Candidatus Neomarinimicrobiota bacterium]